LRITNAFGTAGPAQIGFPLRQRKRAVF
jgi:hypothetical protein